MFDPETFQSTFLELTRKPLWAGFAPLEIPLLIWDGNRTYAFNHPNPPPPFEAEWDWYVMEGRAETIIGNSSGTLEFLPVATVMAANLETADAAAIAIHEAFHVFQGMQYPLWTTNELDALTYPLFDIDVLALRRIESRALSKALALQDLGWVRAALKARASRYAKLAEKHRIYERELERLEGSAYFVEGRARGEATTIAEEDFPASQIRARTYASGRAWIELLTRFAPQSLRDLNKEYADVLLRPVAKSAPERPLTFAILEYERERAAQDIAALQAQQAANRAEFFDGFDFLLEINSRIPLQAQGFDPMNMQILENNEMIHSRYVRLADANGSLEVLSAPSLTIGTENPMHITQIFVKLPNPPSVNRGQVLRVQHEKFKLEWKNAQLELLDRAMRITIED